MKRAMPIVCLHLMFVVITQAQSVPGVTNSSTVLQMCTDKWGECCEQNCYPVHNPADLYGKFYKPTGRDRHGCIQSDKNKLDAYLPENPCKGRKYTPTPSQPSMPQSQMNSYLADSVYEAWTSYYASGLFPAFDYAVDIVADDLGYIYVTGYSSDLPYGRLDYLTAKYDTSGTLIWTVRYNGIGNGDDCATALWVDASGNVYVTGESYTGPSTGYDCVTVKYDAAGVEQWVTCYNGQANTVDMGTCLVGDASGNVYVAGVSYCGPSTGYDYVTVKYNAAGVEQWVANYNGPGNGPDCAFALVTDNSGGIYVTGESYGSGTLRDYATIKYDVAGAEQWVARYNGPGNGTDCAIALSLDPSGGIYVTGESYGSGTLRDYATIKYDVAGVEQWIARYDGPASDNDIAINLVVDDSSNIYVFGSTYDPQTWTHKFATVKYNLAGVEQWVALFTDGTNNEAGDIVLDNSGSVYVTGSSRMTYYDRNYVTVKYNTAGTQQWATYYQGSVSGSYDVPTAIAVDNTGNIYVTGKSGPGDVFGFYIAIDYATVKYNSAGVEQWVACYDGPGNSWDKACDIAHDNAGNTYIAGFSVSSGTSADYFTVKYNADGTEQWVAQYNGQINGVDKAYAIAVDETGCVYVTGMSMTDSMTYDYDLCTVKYDAAGTEQWVVNYSGSGIGADMPYDIAVDDSGNVYVTGSAWGLSMAPDYCTIKYNSAGVEQWAALYDGPANSWDESWALAVDEFGNVYVTGIVSTSSFTTDCVTIKYDATGVEQWVATYNGSANDMDCGSDLAVDDAGNVYIAGTSNNGPGFFEDQDCLVIKYNSVGAEQWIAHYNGPSDNQDFTTAIALDDSNNVYATGASYDIIRDLDYLTIKYDNAGVEQWIASFNGGGEDCPGPFCLAINSGNICIAGYSETSGEEYYDYVAVQYNAAGVEQWVMRNSGPGNSFEDYFWPSLGMTVNDAGDVYVTGSSRCMERDYWSIATTIKYIQTSPGVHEEGTSTSSGFVLTQSCPNPFESSTIIRYVLPNACKVALKIYNSLGQEVETLVSDKEPAGVYTVEWSPENLPNGIYFYSLSAGDFTITKKTALLR